MRCAHSTVFSNKGKFCIFLCQHPVHIYNESMWYLQCIGYHSQLNINVSFIHRLMLKLHHEFVAGASSQSHNVAVNLIHEIIPSFS